MRFFCNYISDVFSCLDSVLMHPCISRTIFLVRLAVAVRAIIKLMNGFHLYEQNQYETSFPCNVRDKISHTCTHTVHVHVHTHWLPQMCIYSLCHTHTIFRLCTCTCTHKPSLTPYTCTTNSHTHTHKTIFNLHVHVHTQAITDSLKRTYVYMYHTHTHTHHFSFKCASSTARQIRFSW